MRIKAALCICLLFVAACEKAADDDDAKAAPAAAADSAADHAAMSNNAKAWVESYNKGDIAAVAALYTEDGEFDDQTGKVNTGRAAIQQTLQQVHDMGVRDLSIQERTYQQVGDVAYSTGDFNETVKTPDGKSAKIDGRYLVVSRRQPDGSWKIVRHTSVGVAPAAPSAR